MIDRFAEFEEPRARTTAGVLSTLLVIGVIVYFQWPPSATGEVNGVVESAGAINQGRLSGGTREVALVRLKNGSLVSAKVVSGGPLEPGDAVILYGERRLFGAPTYWVEQKGSLH